jgi:hypothetical protein
MNTETTIISDPPVDLAMEAAIKEHNAKATTDTPAPAARPQWLPEKFASPEDLSKAYSELEKRFSDPKSKPAPATEASAGLNLDVYAQEYSDTGALSPESISNLVKSGIPEPIIRNYLDGISAMGNAQTEQIFSLVGGEPQYTSMLEWASEHLDPIEITAFNSIMDSGDSGSMNMAVKGLQARYVQMAGQPGRLIQGEVTGPSSGAFRSLAEVTSAMKDPRYAKDSAYRAEVENRLRNSNIIGTANR